MVKKIFLSILIIFVLISCFSVNTLAFTPTSFDIRAESAVLASLDTGEVLYEKDIDAKRYPASLTKIMTAILFIENVNDLENEIITVSDNAVTSLLGTGSSVGGLKPGEQLTAKNMLYLLMMSSANDGAIAVAEHVSGSESAFIALMNEKAAELGMTSTNFVNPHGLHDENHYTSVRDVLTIAKYAMKNSVFAEVVSTARYKLPASNLGTERFLATTNFLIDPSVPYYYYKHAKGLKTGYTDEAGRCFVGVAEKDGLSYICVLMKSTVRNEKNQYVRHEFEDSKSLFEWAFNDFNYKTVLTKGEIVGEADVKLSFSTDFVTVAACDELSTILPKNADLSTVEYKLKLNQQSYDATIKKGEVLGKVDVLYAGKTLGSVDVAATSTVKRNAFLYILRIIKNIITSRVMKVVIIIIILLIIAFFISCWWLNRKKINRNKIKRKKDDTSINRKGR